MKEIFNIKTAPFNVVIWFVLVAYLQACDSILEIDAPSTQISAPLVFADDVTATSAVTGIYVQMLNASSFSSGSGQSITALASLSADEMTTVPESGNLLLEFGNNDLLPQNELILSLWSSCYQIIYQANDIIESLPQSTGLSEVVKRELMGEALFIRAFTHFYLTNMFGSVPLAMSNDYKTNTNIERSGATIIYKQILSDLLEAKTLMSETYPTTERVRPNKSVATALLARVYLYMKDWENAELQATTVIENPIYMLADNPNDVFLSSSPEAIWQLKQPSPFYNTLEGVHFIISSYPQNTVTNESLVNSFEEGDLRLGWINSLDTGDKVFYYPFKYKIEYGGPASDPPVPLTEYSMVFRLAEQYLIRSESRAQLNRLNEAIADVDIIRARADLTLISETIPDITKEDLLLSIEQERRVELFTEWGHRWFDLKRTDRTDNVLGTKPAWESTDVLYPIPDVEFIRNNKLGDQNSGY